MEIIESLKKFGLSEKEAKVYVACLELGDSLASEISLKSNLPRTLVYDILERLIEYGLISYSIKKNKKYFKASDPRELIRILNEKEKAVSSILSKLQSLQREKGSVRPKIEIYEGKDGMKTVMNDILNSNVKEFLAYGSSRSSYEIIPAFMDDWHKKRIKKKIIMKIIYNNTKPARDKVKKLKSSLGYTKYKFMSIELESPTATLIYANKVVLQSWTKESFAVMIEDKEMANNQRKYFEKLWKITKR